jgi:putative transposase
MKNRDYKEFAEGAIVHIYNRGNNRENIFHDEQDYRAFIFRMGLALGFKEKELTHELCRLPHSRIRIENMIKSDFKLHAFCLMPNHFHLLVEQCRDTSISKLISKICTSYAMYINKKYKRVGHVFQDAFKAVVVDSDPQLLWVPSYIHMNPVKDGLTKHPSKYKWSSYNDYIYNRNLPIVHTKFLLNLFGDKKTFETETFRIASDDNMSRTPLDIFTEEI